MSNIPGCNGTQIPYADPPYPIRIGDSTGGIDTDNCGEKFIVIGDKHYAAMALLKNALEDSKSVMNDSFTLRVGAFNFIFENRKIVRIQPYYDFTEEYVDFSPEKRPEVLEMIEIVNKMIPLTAFL